MVSVRAEAQGQLGFVHHDDFAAAGLCDHLLAQARRVECRRRLSAAGRNASDVSSSVAPGCLIGATAHGLRPRFAGAFPLSGDERDGGRLVAEHVSGFSRTECDRYGNEFFPISAEAVSTRALTFGTKCGWLAADT
jgi:hypothetical protein